MPPVRSLVSKRAAYYFKLVAVILLLGEIMPTYSYYAEKGLVYITIVAPLGRQPSFCAKCTKLNICLSCDVRLVSNAKCAFLLRSYILRSLRLPCLICLRVSCDSCYGETRL